MKLFVIFVFVLFNTFLVSPLFAAVPIIPCDGINTPCQACHFVELGQNLITWFTGVMSSFIAIMIAVNGFKMVISGGNTESISQAKHGLINAIVGLIILLTSWLIVDTFLKTFVTGAQIGVWNEVQCLPQPAYRESPPVGGVTVSPGTIGVPGATGGKLSDADARAQLTTAGIGINKTVAEGTSLDNINQNTINDAINLKTNCNCDVTITAGTEGSGGHAIGTISHGTGYKYDIRLNSQLDSYIQKSGWKEGSRTNNGVVEKTYTAPNGSVYAKEGDHWDVLVKS